jgi:cytochrome c biogenesis protein ResB
VGVLGVAVAGMVSGFVGWRGTLNLREGEADNVVLVWRGSEATPKFLPFAVRNDGFVIEQYPSGMPKRYATTLRFEEPGSQVARNQGAEDKQVEVNRPVRFGAYAFYQASFGDGGSKVAGKGVNLSGGRVVPFEGHVYDKARLLDGTRVEIVDFRPFTVETQAGQKPVDVGPSVDYLVQPPDAEAVQLRAYLQHPELVGVADGQKIGGANDGAVVYRMVKVGGQVGRDAGGQEAWWRMMGRILGGEDFKAVAGPELAGIADEDLRVETGLELMQAVKVVKALKLTHVLLLEDFELKRYSGLQVAYDPGATPFWIAACLLVLGVVLMVGRRFSRVFVKDGMGFVVSPHGIRVVREVEGELRSGEADYS